MLYEQEKIAIEYFKECIKKGSIFEEDLTLNFMQTSLYLIERLQKENEEKDNIINLMADSFAEEGFYNEYCQTLIDNELCPNDCNKCVKQYFEKLAKENK